MYITCMHNFFLKVWCHRRRRWRKGDIHCIVNVKIIKTGNKQLRNPTRATLNGISRALMATHDTPSDTPNDTHIRYDARRTERHTAMQYDTRQLKAEMSRCRPAVDTTLPSKYQVSYCIVMCRMLCAVSYVAPKRRVSFGVAHRMPSVECKSHGLPVRFYHQHCNKATKTSWLDKKDRSRHARLDLSPERKLASTYARPPSCGCTPAHLR